MSKYLVKAYSVHMIPAVLTKYWCTETTEMGCSSVPCLAAEWGCAEGQHPVACPEPAEGPGV
jgi:hypothetical protein